MKTDTDTVRKIAENSIILKIKKNFRVNERSEPAHQQTG
jgi:hypothetical protein